MEPSRFDELTKVLATATSRRQALKAIGAALGGALGVGSIGTAFADKTCKKLGQGCNNKKNLCCPGLICQGGMCVAAPGNPYTCFCSDGTTQATCNPAPCSLENVHTVCGSLCATHGGSLGGNCSVAIC